MSLRFATPSEIEQWNDRILSNPDQGNVFQGYEFSQQKRLGGWTPRYIVSDAISITVLQKHIVGLGHIWYVPKGPGIAHARQLDELLRDLRKFARKHGAFMVKIEPELLKSPETEAELLKFDLVKAQPIQPNASTVLIDLHPSVDAILAGLNQKGRHAIKRAERDGVTVKKAPASDENCRALFDLLTETAAGSFRIRSYDYYKTFWQRYSDARQGQLFFAYVDDRLVAGAFAIIFGTKSTYKDGASVRERTVYGASHLLQWHVIQWAKENGAVVHDLCGAPPSDQIKNPSHPHYGIGRFKTSFNKTVTDYVGAYDIPVKPTQYQLWRRFGEKIALRLYSYQHNENYY
ncbi:peptidoglycan bridge formation glycyltransferase FemA/FemB family protein [Streptomyces caniscabiei]|uniref:lipid II:glycine glycyltransferase FemX n=1 Tax=Streptomyces caniscabiei TaxID=2746961 RepID=UPI0029BD7CBC|nr:peptidoglycan bridge formation glycyltransferase FemA/FemB family protein [Streptomyces caniscabiei]MDX2776361.1 peptidoglycan bridge formation glycyltransferase FemA/FemB family protein [Streptomyces caniscabiei]